MKRICLFVLSSFFVCVLSFFFVFGVYTLGKSGGEGDGVSSIHKYRVVQVNPSSGETSVGYVEFPKELEEEYSFYSDENGNLNLISEFGSQQYSCTGTCYCSSEEERRVPSSVLTKPVFYLVSAVSTALAYRFAKEYFEEECGILLMSEGYSCKDNSRISSGVEVCEDLDLLKESEEEETFLCEGLCRPLNYKYVMNFKNNPVVCNQIRVRDVFIQVPKYDPEYPNQKSHFRARKKFMEKHFKPHCHKLSMFKFPKTFKERRLAGKERNLCVADQKNASCFRLD